MIAAEHVAASPESVGVSAERLQELFERVDLDVGDGKLPSAQVAVARGGRLAGIHTAGRAVQGGTDRPATHHTLYCIYSSTKAVVASAIWALLEDGRLEVAERVAEIVPAFAGLGKDGITVEQVLLHTAGFPYAPMHPRLWEDREARLERMRGWRLNWEPGSRYEYHATSAHWVLAEIITARTGNDFRDYIRTRITEPMGLPELYVGLPDEQHARAADVRYVEEPVAPEGGWREVNPDTVLHFNEAPQRRSGCPGAGGFTSAAELAMFYQVLIRGGEGLTGRQVLRSETIAMATEVRTDASHRDAPRGDIPVNRGLGVIVAGDDGNAESRGFGRETSARAFGHGGAGGQVAWGDPESGISLGYLTNGFAEPDAIAIRTSEISTLAARCAL